MYVCTWIYIAPCPYTHRALRHGSHSFTCKLHHACLDSLAAEHHRPLAGTHFTVPTEGKRLSRPGTVVAQLYEILAYV